MGGTVDAAELALALVVGALLMGAVACARFLIELPRIRGTIGSHLGRHGKRVSPANSFPLLAARSATGHGGVRVRLLGELGRLSTVPSNPMPTIASCRQGRRERLDRPDSAQNASSAGWRNASSRLPIAWLVAWRTCCASIRRRFAGTLRIRSMRVRLPAVVRAVRSTLVLGGLSRGREAVVWFFVSSRGGR